MLVDELTVTKTSKQEEELTQNLLQQYTASSSAHNSPLSWKHDECPLQLESKFSSTNRWLAGAGRWLTGGSLPPKLTDDCLCQACRKGQTTVFLDEQPRAIKSNQIWPTNMMLWPDQTPESKISHMVSVCQSPHHSLLSYTDLHTPLWPASWKHLCLSQQNGFMTSQILSWTIVL